MLKIPRDRDTEDKMTQARPSGRAFRKRFGHRGSEVFHTLMGEIHNIIPFHFSAVLTRNLSKPLFALSELFPHHPLKIGKRA